MSGSDTSIPSRAQFEALYASFNELEKAVLNAASLSADFTVDYIVSVTDHDDAPIAMRTLVNSGVIINQQALFSLALDYRDAAKNEFLYLNRSYRNQLIQRAIRYWLNKGELDKALSYCVEYEFWELAVEALYCCCEDFINAGRFEQLHKWFERLPSQAIEDKPLLKVYRAWCFPEYQKISAVDTYLAQIEAQIASQSSEPENLDCIKAEVQLLALRGYISRISGQYQNAVTHAQNAVKLAAKHYPAMLSRLYTTIGQDLYLKGDVIAAEASLTQAMSLGKQYKKHHDVLISLGYSVASILLSGHPSKAIQVFDVTKAWFTNSGLSEYDEMAMLNDILIDVYRETFQLEKAQQHADIMLQFCENTSPALQHLTTHMRRYRIAMNSDNPSAAYEALTQAEGYKEILGVAWAFGWLPIDAMRAEYELTYGSLNTATQFFEAKETELLTQSNFTNEGEHFVYALWLSKTNQHQKAWQHLKAIKSRALQEHRLLNAIRADVQLAIALHEHDPASALLHLRDALQLVPTNEKLIGPFLWYGKSILPLLDKVASKLYQDPKSMRLLQEIRKHAESLWPNQMQDNVLNLLSKRQLMILQHLVEGDQDKVIAKKLGISPGTVKTHLRAIYRKLECNNRAQAVSIAMEYGAGDTNVSTPEQQAN